MGCSLGSGSGHAGQGWAAHQCHDSSRGRRAGEGLQRPVLGLTGMGLMHGAGGGLVVQGGRESGMAACRGGEWVGACPAPCLPVAGPCGAVQGSRVPLSRHHLLSPQGLCRYSRSPRLSQASQVCATPGASWGKDGLGVAVSGLGTRVGTSPDLLPVPARSLVRKAVLRRRSPFPPLWRMRRSPMRSSKTRLPPSPAASCCCPS